LGLRGRKEVTGDWIKLQSEELHGLFSPDIVQVIKSRRMRWDGHVAYEGKKRSACRDLAWKPERKKCHSEDLGVDGRIILN
jgi:hypothetical protein